MSCVTDMLYHSLTHSHTLPAHIHSWCNESQSNCNSCNGSWFGSSGSGTGGIDIGEQGSGTVQIVNESSETNLHVFFQSNNLGKGGSKLAVMGLSMILSIGDKMTPVHLIHLEQRSCQRL